MTVNMVLMRGADAARLSRPTWSRCNDALSLLGKSRRSEAAFDLQPVAPSARRAGGALCWWCLVLVVPCAGGALCWWCLALVVPCPATAAPRLGNRRPRRQLRSSAGMAPPRWSSRYAPPKATSGTSSASSASATGPAGRRAGNATPDTRRPLALPGAPIGAPGVRSS